jgi:hypothetical protein
MKNYRIELDNAKNERKCTESVSIACTLVSGAVPKERRDKKWKKANGRSEMSGRRRSEATYNKFSVK